MTKFYKNVCKLLIITLLVTMTPINAIIVSATDDTEEVTTKKNQEAEIVRELEEKREENTKYFLKDDGTYEAILYEEPIHYLKNGKWIDINNSLHDKGNYYENKENEFTVRIGKNASDKELISVSKDKYKIWWNIGVGIGEKLEEVPVSDDKGVEEEKPAIDNEKNEETEKPSTEDKPSEENEKPSSDDKQEGEIDNPPLDGKTDDETEPPSTEDKKGGETEKPTTNEEIKDRVDDSPIDSETTKLKKKTNLVGKVSKNTKIDNTSNKEKEKIKENKEKEEKKDSNKDEKVSKETKENNKADINGDVKKSNSSDKNKNKDNDKLNKKNKNRKIKNISKLSKASVENTDIDKVIDEMVEQQLGGNRRSKRSISNNKSLRDKIKKEIDKKFLPNVKSSVEFKSIYENIDLEYKLIGKTVKENIILNEKIDNPSILFNLNIENLKPRVEGNIIIFEDLETGAEVFQLDKPFMYDAKGELSEDIELIFKEAEEGGYTLEIVPNNEWINDDKREFPITVDPIVRTEMNTKEIVDTFTAYNDTQDKWNNMFLRVGNNSGIGKTETYVKFTKLPKLNAGDMVVNAELALFKVNSESGADGQINAYTVTENWNTSVPNKKSLATEKRILDIQTVKNGWYSWDVTKAVKGWYTEGNNYGIALKRDNPASGNTTFLSSDAPDQHKAGWPLVVIQYVNNTGLENYWTYHSQDMGRSGIGYINDYNGNVVFTHNDYTASDSRLALKIEHVYNSNDKETDIGYGKGWKLNIQQRITEQVINGTTYYKYFDSDGTNHYFYYDSASKTYKCESLEGIKFTKNNDGSYMITDKDRNKLYFVPGGYLKTITDTNNNTNTILYDGTRISGVKDSIGRTTLLQYTSGGTLIGITDPAGRKTSYAYNGIQLSRITYPDGKASYYTYEGNNNLSSVKSLDGAKLLYTYYGGSTSRVKTATYVDTAGTQGQSLAFKYSYNETEIKDVKGRTNTYQFNNGGNTISIKDSNGSAQYYKYDSNEKAKNRLELESKVQKTSNNYLMNHNCELKDGNWSAGSWSGSAGTNEFTTTKANMGKYSLKVNMTNKTSRRFYSQAVTLEKGKTYTFSGYVSTDGISNTNKKGAALFVNYTDNTGNYVTKDSKYISGTTGWDRESITFTLPSDATSNLVYIRCGLIEESGTAYFDNLQVEDGEVANRYNLVENPNFVVNGAPNANFWTTSNWESTNGLYTTTDSTYPSNLDKIKAVYKMPGNTEKDKSIYQTINVSGKKDDVFVVGGWAKAESLPLIGNGRYFALDVGLEKPDGSYEWTVIPFNGDSSTWQYVSGQVVAKSDYKSVRVYGLYYKNANIAYFDGFQLYKEEFGASYQYDDKGNITSTEDLIKQKTNYKYDGDDKLTSVTDPKGNTTKYSYDGNRNLIQTTTAENIVSSFIYDEYGNSVVSKISGSGLFMESSNISSDTAGYTKRTIDTSGNEILNVYSESKDNLDVTINSQEVSTYYGYDETDKLINTSAYNPYGDKKTGETFLVNGNSSGDLGSKSLGLGATPVKDNKGHYTFKVQDGGGVPYNLGISKNKGTIALKFKPQSNGSLRYLLCSSSPNGGSLAVYVNTSNKLCLAFKDSSGIWKESIVLNKAISANTWYSMIVQWENTSSGLKATLTIDDEVKNATVSNVKDFTGGKVIVGADFNNKNALNGEVEELYCSTGVDNLTELKQHYNKLKSGNYGYYKNWDEYVPLRGNSSSINGLRALTDKSKYDSSNELTMQATGDRYANYSSGIRDNSGTMNLWLKPSASTSTRYIFSGTTRENIGVIEAYLASDNKVKLSVKNSSGNIVDIITSNTAVTTGQWNMLTISWNKSGTTLTTNMYINGNKEKSVSGTYKDFSGANICIGQKLSGSSIEGNLDELILSSKCYDDNTVKSMYTKGRGKVTARVGQNNYAYNNDRLSKVSSNSTSYNFTYDGNGNQKSVAVGSSTLITNNYDNVSGVLKNATYGNGNTVAYAYDNLNRVTSKTLDGKTASKYTYDNSGNLAISQDLKSGITNKYTYDLADRLVKTEDSSGNWFKYDYDKTDKTSKKENYIAGKSYSTSFNFDKDGKTTKVALPSGKSLAYSYDSIGRTKSKILNLDNSKTFNTEYEYKAGYAGSTTSMVSSIKNGNSEIKYTYDALGRIETVNNGQKIEYYYNELNQLIREVNNVLKKTIVYTYDAGGNILNKVEHIQAGIVAGAQRSYSYAYEDPNWKDKLTSYGGKAITYDSIGNPLTYDGYTFKWEGGRTLSSITGNDKNINYKYNSDGIRTEKTVNGVNYKYTLEGSNVVYEEITNGSAVDKIVYNYGDNGLVGFTLNGKEYFYIRNAQSDIIGILDSNGTQVVSYIYDTWGKLRSITGDKALGEKNPYRYRGYRYDTETGYYYLQSRYYNPEWGRFLNGDAIGGSIGELLSHNTFAYCNNNPVISKDPNGFRPMYTQGEETAAMRDASYKVMNNYGKRKNKNTSGVITTRTTSGYTRHVADAEIANVTGIYGKSGVFGSCEISTPDFPIQAYLGGATGIGAVWNGDNKWDVYELGLHLTPLKAGGRLKGGIGIFNCELQVGASLGIGVSFTTGGYADSSGFGVVLGAAASWFFGAEVTGKVWIDF